MPISRIIPIAQPNIGEEEKNAVLEVLDSGMLAQGKQVETLEQQFAEFIGTDYAIATSNGTTALHLALLALGIGPGDEVITTSFSFIASSNAIVYTGARPVFVDIDPTTFTLNPDLIESKITSKTKAILPVHLFGLPADMTKIKALADKHHLFIIEDACQAHGATLNGQKTGSFGDIACYSFYPTKNMTTGEGGMITTNNEELAEKLRLLRSHGMKVRYHHDILGYNFRMTDIAAAIGLAQLKKLPDFNKARQDNAQYYVDTIKNPKIELPITPPGMEHVFHQFTVKVKDNRDTFINYLQHNNIGSSIFYPIPIHQQKIYQDLGFTDSLPETVTVASQVVSLPVHPLVTQEELEYIAEIINQF